MEFRRGHLLYFVTVADEGQITRAARKLHIAQPALSQAIAQLESDLGLRLLERHARGVRLTPAGEEFLVKARLALDAWASALATARSFATTHEGKIEFGFLGAPPALDSPDDMQRFAESAPAVEVHYRELPFPSLPTSTWIAEVDVAVCHSPPLDNDVWTEFLRAEPRVLLAPRRHALASRSAVDVEAVLDETFIGFADSVAPAWAGFWSLDDHRGSPPRRVTADRSTNPQEVLASLAMRDAVTTVPASVARMVAGAFDELRVVELRGAAPAVITLAGHRDRRNASVATLIEYARRGHVRAASA